MALGTCVYNRALEKQIWLRHIEQALSGIAFEKRYWRYDGVAMTEYQIKVASSNVVHNSPKLYHYDDGRALTKYDINAALRHTKRTSKIRAKQDMEATIADVENFLAEERLYLLLPDNEGEKPGYRTLIAQTAPSGFAKPVEEKRLPVDFIFHFPEYELSGCFCMN